jgi:hypothetical protein
VLALTLALDSTAIATETPMAHPSPPPIEELPGSKQSDVVRALRKIRRKYGNDAVLLQTQLLLAVMRGSALRASASGVEGVTEHEGKRYLQFDVETGLVFDNRTRDETSRIHIVWMTIVAPVLERLTEPLKVPADGIMVALQYHHRPYQSAAELRATIDQPGTSEITTFYLLTPNVTELLDRRVDTRALIERARVTVDGKERTVRAPERDAPTAPGPG